MFDQLSRRRAAKTIISAGVAGFAVAAVSSAQQPKMEEALSHLKAARESLDKAAHNKGGHRVNAIKLVDQAIEEVKAGIAAGA